jgi:hypothetical protein
MNYKNVNIIEKGDKRYIKFHHKSGKRKQFRYYDNTPIDAYDKLYKDKEKGKYKGSSKKYIDLFMNRHKQKVVKPEHKKIILKGKRMMKKNVSFNSGILKGTSRTEIPDINKMTASINKYYEDLFKTLVYDKDLLKIIATRHNVQKLKHRLQHNIIYFDQNGSPLGTTSVIGTKEPEMVIQDQRKVIQKYSFLEDSSLDRGSGKSAGFKKMLEEMGYPQYRHYSNGQISRVSVEIIFRN